MGKAAEYMAETARVIQAIPAEQIAAVAELLEHARADGRRIFVCGNGGSASLASHLACDFNKGCCVEGRERFKILALTDNVPTMTAYGNDVEYGDIFLEQLENFFEPGDVVMGISGSGNSENVVRTLAWAKEHGGATIGWLGFGGGRCKPLCDIAVVADSHDMQHCEDAHVVLMHLLMQIFRDKVEVAHVG